VGDISLDARVSGITWIVVDYIRANLGVRIALTSSVVYAP